jgi:hypothetical protein
MNTEGGDQIEHEYMKRWRVRKRSWVQGIRIMVRLEDGSTLEGEWILVRG